MLKAIFSIIRWPNLLLLGLIQGVVFTKLIDWHWSIMNGTDVILLILITMLIGAGGYVINDYYDIEIDKINKPKQWIAGNQLSTGQVLRLYKGLIVAGAILAVSLGVRLDLLIYFPIYLLAVVGLQWYSSRLKCTVLLGNLWVSIFCAGVIVIMALPDLIRKNDEVLKPFFWYYTFFAFLTTWFREIVKDLEDMQGDRQQGCRTLVVWCGEHKGKIVSLVIAVGLIVSLWLWEQQLTSWVFKTGLVVLEGSVVACGAFIWWAKDNTYYHRASQVIKFIMAGGTLLLLLPS